MKVTVVYVYPNNGDTRFNELALRFINGYHANEPGWEHDTVIVSNGGMMNDELQFLFSSLPNCEFPVCDNSGMDIGAFQYASQNHPADLMVFFGASTYFRGPGWLHRMVESFDKHGNGLYGTMGDRGTLTQRVWPHIRTTAFWLPSDLFNRYPKKVTDPSQRYPFEHGRDCLTSWIKKQGFLPWVVAWDGEYLHAEWDNIAGGFHQGDQHNLMVGDRFSEPPYHPVP